MSTLTAMREGARERAREMAGARQRRWEKAWEVARMAAALLKSRYHATRVVVFGSLTEAERFHPWSDVDLAVWGIAPEDYFEAVAQVLDVGGEIKVDLVLGARCKPCLREAIEQGITL